MLPINLPFCVLFQSNTEGYQERISCRANDAQRGKRGLRTVKGQEREGELDTGKDTKEEEMEYAERLECLDALLSGTSGRFTTLLYVLITATLPIIPPEAV